MEVKLNITQGTEVGLFAEVAAIIKTLEMAQAQSQQPSGLIPIMQQFINTIGPVVPEQTRNEIYAKLREQYGMAPVMDVAHSNQQQQQPQQQPQQQQIPQQQQPPQQQPGTGAAMTDAKPQPQEQQELQGKPQPQADNADAGD